MGLSEAIADVDLARDAIANATSLDDLKQQLVDNLFPAIKGVADAATAEIAAITEVVGTLSESIESVEDDVEQLIDQEGDILQPDTTQKILAVLEAGKILSNELEQLLGKADAATKKRCAPLLKGYRQGCAVITDYLGEITIPAEPDRIDEVEEEIAAKEDKKTTKLRVVKEAPPDDDADDDDDEDADGDDADDGEEAAADAERK